MSRIERIGDATRIVAIYALCEPDWTPRYVGKTVQFLHERHKAHIRAATRGGKLPVHYWLRKRMAAGEMLAIKLLEYVRDGAWAERETHWISSLRQAGADLLNMTTGGEGLPGHRFTQEHRDKIANSLKRGRTHQCAVCGASFWRKPKDAKSPKLFCSRVCSNRRHKGVRHGA